MNVPLSPAPAPRTMREGFERTGNSHQAVTAAKVRTGIAQWRKGIATNCKPVGDRLRSLHHHIVEAGGRETRRVVTADRETDVDRTSYGERVLSYRRPPGA